MCTYCSTTNYRKIYENHHGPILREADGRAYEVHHIDGNHANNDPNNLTLVTLQEHYNIHYLQGDYAACYFMMIDRMQYSPRELSAIAKKNALSLVEQGIHPWLTRSDGSNVNTDRVANGTHNFLKRTDGSSIATDRVKSGAHHLLKRADGSSHITDRIAKGTHPTQLKVCCVKCRRIIGGAHNLKNHLVKC